MIFPSFAELENKVKEAADEIKRLRTSSRRNVTDETKAIVKERIKKINIIKSGEPIRDRPKVSVVKLNAINTPPK